MVTQMVTRADDKATSRRVATGAGETAFGWQVFGGATYRKSMEIQGRRYVNNPKCPETARKYEWLTT
jgi:hypothetical protein